MSLLTAPHFRELLEVRRRFSRNSTNAVQLILQFGNFMNASGNKGGAHGFRVSSINKLVDTKSSITSDRTLLHQVANVIQKHEPQMEAFLEELAPPAEAHKGPSGRRLSYPVLMTLAADLVQVRTVLSELRTQQRALANELEEHFVNAEEIDSEDGFAKCMFPFSKAAKYRLDELSDMVTNAGGKYAEALVFYGEDTKSIASTPEFFSIFKTFVTSYEVCHTHLSRQGD